MTDHSPLPWLQCEKWICEENDPGHNVGICICEDRDTGAETLANGALIVRACNAHHYLLSTLVSLDILARAGKLTSESVLEITTMALDKIGAVSLSNGDGKGAA